MYVLWNTGGRFAAPGIVLAASWYDRVFAYV
jgi:hypothetical protein